MLEYERDLLNSIRDIGVVFELDGHDALAEQVRQIGEQVARMVDDNTALRARLNALGSRASDSCGGSCFELDLANARVKRLEAAMRNHGIWPARG